MMWLKFRQAKNATGWLRDNMHNESAPPKPLIFIDSWAYLTLALSYLSSVVLLSGFVIFFGWLPATWSGVKTFGNFVVQIFSLFLLTGLPSFLVFNTIILFRRHINITTITFWCIPLLLALIVFLILPSHPKLLTSQTSFNMAGGFFVTILITALFRSFLRSRAEFVVKATNNPLLDQMSKQFHVGNLLLPIIMLLVAFGIFILNFGYLADLVPKIFN